MKIKGAVAAACLAIASACPPSLPAAGYSGADLLPPDISFTVKSAMDIVKRWPGPSREAAVSMLMKYGDPDELTSRRLSWKDRGVWLEITVSRDGHAHRFPAAHEDVLEQAVAYAVPVDKFTALARFNGSVAADRTRGTLSSRCSSEEMNLVALNLAHDIITNRRSPEEAREMHADIARAHEAGETHPYARRLGFREAKVKDSADPDYSP